VPVPRTDTRQSLLGKLQIPHFVRDDKLGWWAVESHPFDSAQGRLHHKNKHLAWMGRPILIARSGS